MGRQAFLTRLALGRSAYEAPAQPSYPPVGSEDLNGHTAGQVSLAISHESGGERDTESGSDVYVQLYDSRGRPRNSRSRDQHRAVLRAGNEILAATGYITKKSNEGKDEPKSDRKSSEELAEDENDSGAALLLTTASILDLATWCPNSLRSHIHVYQPISAKSFFSLMEGRRRRFGTTSLFCAGLLTSCGSSVVEFLISIALGDAGQKLDSIFLDNGKKPGGQTVYTKTKGLYERGGHYLFSFLYWSALVYPLRALSYLENLGMLHSSPLYLPMLSDLGALFPSSPLFLQHVGLLPYDEAHGLLARTSEFLNSPLFLLFAHQTLYYILETRFNRLLRQYLPHPSLPSSITAEEDEDWHNKLPADSQQQRLETDRSFRDIIFNPSSTLNRWATDVFEYLHRFQGTGVAEGEQSQPELPNGAFQRAQASQEDLQNTEVLLAAIDHEAMHGNEAVDQPVQPETLATSGIATENSPPVGLEIDNAQLIRRRRKYRVTALSSHSSVLLSCALSGLVATWVLVPLESLALQALVRTTLDTSSSSFGLQINYDYLTALGGLQPHQLERQGFLAGLGRAPLGSLSVSWHSYAVCLGLDIAFRFLVFESGHTVGKWIGCSRYRWGDVGR